MYGWRKTRTSSNNMFIEKIHSKWRTFFMFHSGNNSWFCIIECSRPPTASWPASVRSKQYNCRRHQLQYVTVQCQRWESRHTSSSVTLACKHETRASFTSSTLLKSPWTCQRALEPRRNVTSLSEIVWLMSAGDTFSSEWRRYKETMLPSNVSSRAFVVSDVNKTYFNVTVYDVRTISPPFAKYGGGCKYTSFSL